MNKFEDKVLITFITLSIVVQILAFYPKFREVFPTFFQNNDRFVLAKIDGQLHPHKEPIRIIKYLEKNELFIEAYLHKEGFSDEFITRTRLNDKKDGFFTYQGKSTNLALSDIDRDGDMEILVPTYNKDLMPRLRAFKLNFDLNIFEPMNLSLIIDD